MAAEHRSEAYYLAIFFHTREVFGSNLGPETCYPNRTLLLSFVPPYRFLDIAFK